MKKKTVKRKEPLAGFIAFAASEAMVAEAQKISDSLGCSVSWWMRRILQKEIERLNEQDKARNIQRSGPLDFIVENEKPNETKTLSTVHTPCGWKLEDLLNDTTVDVFQNSLSDEEVQA